MITDFPAARRVKAGGGGWGEEGWGGGGRPGLGGSARTAGREIGGTGMRRRGLTRVPLPAQRGRFAAARPRAPGTRGCRTAAGVGSAPRSGLGGPRESAGPGSQGGRPVLEEAPRTGSLRTVPPPLPFAPLFPSLLPSSLPPCHLLFLLRRLVPARPLRARRTTRVRGAAGR